jgi:hypothetical protein
MNAETLPTGYEKHRWSSHVVRRCKLWQRFSRKRSWPARLSLYVRSPRMARLSLWRSSSECS